MFIMHIGLLLASIVLLASTAFIIWALRNKGDGSFFGLTIGSLVFILSLLSMISMSYVGIKSWSQSSTPPGVSMEMRKQMMQKMRPEMMQKMKERMEKIKNMREQQSKESTQPQEPVTN